MLQHLQVTKRRKCIYQFNIIDLCWTTTTSMQINLQIYVNLQLFFQGKGNFKYSQFARRVGCNCEVYGNAGYDASFETSSLKINWHF